MFEEMKQTPSYMPPPWSLKGSGFILIYRFTKEFIAENGFLATFQKENFQSGWGTVMLVDYQTSPVGPYYELLFIPGIFSFNKKKVFSISKIYVSTHTSVVNGIENWGIPKEQADFRWIKKSKGDQIEITKEGNSIFKADFTKGWVRFPISTSLVPLSLIQQRTNQLMLTQPRSKGTAHFAKLSNLRINPIYFPDISQVKPLISLKVEDFIMEFPHPTEV
jgi:acetoacetate decarboxylase